MTIKGQSAVIWSKTKAECKETNQSDGMGSGCDFDKGSTSDYSRSTETEKTVSLSGEANSSPDFSFSDGLPVDGTSCIYQLTQGKGDLTTCESSAALVCPIESLISQPLDDTVKKTPHTDYQSLPDRLFIEEQRESKARLLPQVLASLALAIAAMIEGYSSGYTSPALASMTSPDSTIPVNDQQASWIGSLMPLNALVGGIIGGTIIERYGRKKTIMATGPPYILSWLLITFAVNLPMVYVGRSIQGFCVGLTTLVLPIYLGETIQPHVRGSLGLLPTTIGNTGILLCYILGSYIDWKILATIGATLPVPFLVFMSLIPETPRWYISKGRYNQARESLQWYRGAKTDIDDELMDIEKNYKSSSSESNNIKELLRLAYVRPLLISLGLMFFQQMSGINAVIFYTVSIFEKSGGSVDSNLSSIIIGLANFFATLGSNLVIDRVGRKVLLNVSASFMALSLAVLGTFFLLQHLDYNVGQAGFLPLVSFIVYIVAFSIGYGPIPWLMMGEIFPSKVRGHAASLATAFNWSCSFAVTKFFNDLINTVGTHGAFWFFGSICFLSLFFVTFFVPETKGHTLEDIEKHMLNNKSKQIISTKL